MKNFRKWLAGLLFLVTCITAGSSAFAAVTEKLGPMPPVRYDVSTETFTNLSTYYSVTYGTGDTLWHPVTQEEVRSGIPMSARITALTPGTTLQVKFVNKLSGSYTRMLPRVFTFYPRSAGPLSYSATNTTGLRYDASKGVVVGTTNMMQYRLKGTSTWRGVSGTSINCVRFLTPEEQTLEVRYKQTGASSASLPTEVILDPLSAAPVVTLDEAEGLLRDMDYTKKYQAATSGGWRNLFVKVDGTCDISNMYSTSRITTLRVRFAATETALASAEATFTLSRRRVAPATPKIVYDDVYYPDMAVLMGLEVGLMEYCKEDERIWSTCTQEKIPLIIPGADDGQVVYLVRYKQMDNQQIASMPRKVTLLPIQRPPSVRISINTLKLEGLSSTMQIKFDNEEYQPALPFLRSGITEQVNQLLPGDTLKITIRKKTTASRPASVPTELTYGYPLEPDVGAVSYEYDKTRSMLTLKGLDTKWQYSLDNKLWRTVPDVTMNIKPFTFTGGQSQDIWFRLKATATMKASDGALLTITEP